MFRRPLFHRWWYHSHVNTNLGLLGPIHDQESSARSNGRPVDVDREFVTEFFIFTKPTARREVMHSINGYVSGTLGCLTMRDGEKARWHLLGMGN